MTPRKYRLGKRRASVAETRQRVIHAAFALYQEQGISSTTMQDVARRADVAAGTVFNHFSTPDDLATAVMAHLSVALEVPGEAMFAGLQTVPEKVARLVRELAAFYVRSEPWYRIHERDKDRIKALAEAEVRFFEGIDQLTRLALGPLGADEKIVAVVQAMTNPGVVGDLRAMGLSTEVAADLVLELLLPWLGRIADDRTSE